jgi:hypothetical protein
MTAAFTEKLRDTHDACLFKNTGQTYESILITPFKTRKIFAFICVHLRTKAL